MYHVCSYRRERRRSWYAWGGGKVGEGGGLATATEGRGRGNTARDGVPTLRLVSRQYARRVLLAMQRSPWPRRLRVFIHADVVAAVPCTFSSSSYAVPEFSVMCPGLRPRRRRSRTSIRKFTRAFKVLSLAKEKHFLRLHIWCDCL